VDGSAVAVSVEDVEDVDAKTAQEAGTLVVPHRFLQVVAGAQGGTCRIACCPDP